MEKMEERAKMILAMEFIARHINDERFVNAWLMCGVADGDIEFGETDVNKVETYYLEDDNFSEIMDCFLRNMVRASKSGGLYCDKVTTSID